MEMMAHVKVYLPIGWVSHVEKEGKRSKKKGKSTDCRFEKKSPSVCTTGPHTLELVGFPQKGHLTVCLMIESLLRNS